MPRSVYNYFDSVIDEAKNTAIQPFVSFVYSTRPLVRPISSIHDRYKGELCEKRLEIVCLIVRDGSFNVSSNFTLDLNLRSRSSLDKKKINIKKRLDIFLKEKLDAERFTRKVSRNVKKYFRTSNNY